ncbi:MAG: hypothetical protein IID33_17175, partial [Planctomycetes bacterium]|nr:hypothetical protein [Planctomycetota bacterium]
MRFVRVPAVASLLILTACELPGRRDDQSGLGPVTERMRLAYPDLAAGRFIILADFESPADAELFRITAGELTLSDERQPSISVLRARERTGAGGLKATLTNPDESIRLDGLRSQSLQMPRDWRAYALLIASIYGPDDGALLEFAIHSGESPSLVWRTRLRLEPGWNLIRIDLAEPGPRVDLADVRALTWSAPNITGPLDLYFDDIALADNERTILPGGAAADELYALSRGRRIYVGANGRFELAFTDGVIAGWHPSREKRRINLTVPSGLGPWPVMLDREWASAAAGVAYDDSDMFADWGDRVAAGQKIIEASAFRVVMLSQWKFQRSTVAAASRPAALPGHVWQYTIYPSGKVYVRLTSDDAGAGWSRPLLGAAVVLDGREGFEPADRLAANSSGVQPRFVLLSRRQPGRADLLWTPYDADLARTQRAFESADRGRLAVVLGGLPPAESADSAHMLRIWPTDLDGIAEGASLSQDYRDPVRIEPTVGRVVSDSPGDMDGDGFNESQGCYELAPIGGVLRFTFDPGRRSRHQPVF